MSVTDSSCSLLRECAHCRRRDRHSRRHHHAHDSRYSVPFVYNTTAEHVVGGGIGPPPTNAIATAVPGYYQAAIEALRAENKALRRELRAAQADARENHRLREEQIRLTVSCPSRDILNSCVWMTCTT